jgi:hypothetical protein
VVALLVEAVAAASEGALADRMYVTLAGGPSPRRGGEVEMCSYEVKVVGRKTFKQAYTDFEPMVMAPFLTFARSVFG